MREEIQKIEIIFAREGGSYFAGIGDVLFDGKRLPCKHIGLSIGPNGNEVATFTVSLHRIDVSVEEQSNEVPHL